MNRTDQALKPTQSHQPAGVVSAALPSRPETRTPSLVRRYFLYAVAPLAILAVWSSITYGGIVSSDTMPSPSGLLERFKELNTEGYRGVPLYEHAWVSLRRTMIGFAAAAIIAIPLGLLIGSVRWVHDLMSPVFSFIRPIPPIAFIPLAVLYLGLGEISKIVLIFFTALVYIVLNAEAGVQSVPTVLIRASESMGLSRSQILRLVILRGSMPSILSGVRTGLAVSWAVVVAAELIAAQSGLGFMISNAAAFFDLPAVFCGILVIGLIGLLLDTAVLFLASRILHWQGR